MLKNIEFITDNQSSIMILISQLAMQLEDNIWPIARQNTCFIN